MNNTEVLFYNLLEHTERIADSLEKLTGLLSPEAETPPPPEAAIDQRTALSLFLEGLSSIHYNSLRRKLLPAGLAAKMLGVSPARLAALTRHGFLKARGGRYDFMNLLMWLDSQANGERC